MKVGVFPEAFLRAMSAEDRRAIGQPTMAEAEADRQYERRQEKELKRDVLNWLNLQGAWVFTQRMHKRARGKRAAGGVVCVAYSLRDVMGGLSKARKPGSPRKMMRPTDESPSAPLILNTYNELRTRRRRRQTF